jgi:hypothetical protein
MLKINSLESLKEIPSIKNKIVVVRFKMENCIHCINSQPNWDNMIDKINSSYQLSPNTLISEIDSTVADEFVSRNNCTTEDNTPYVVSGYPEHVIIENGKVYPSNSDIPTTMKTIIQKLKENKRLRTKTRKRRQKKLKK